jgi:hypothetical protein
LMSSVGCRRRSNFDDGRPLEVGSIGNGNTDGSRRWRLWRRRFGWARGAEVHSEIASGGGDGERFLAVRAGEGG